MLKNNIENLMNNQSIIEKMKEGAKKQLIVF